MKFLSKKSSFFLLRLGALLFLLLLSIILITFLSGDNSQKSPDNHLFEEFVQDYTNKYGKISLPEKKVFRPEYDLPLDDEVKDYIWELSLKNRLSYELVLSIIFVESSFNPDATGYNETSIDQGLGQLNSRYSPVWAERLGIENFDPYNPYQNLQVMFYVLTKHRDYFAEQGLCGQEVYKLTLSAYNRGRDNGLAHDYIRKVTERKSQLERGM